MLPGDPFSDTLSTEQPNDAFKRPNQTPYGLVIASIVSGPIIICADASKMNTTNTNLD